MTSRFYYSSFMVLLFLTCVSVFYTNQNAIIHEIPSQDASMVSSSSNVATLQRSNVIRQSEEILPLSINEVTIASNAMSNKNINEDKSQIRNTSRNDDDLGVLRRYADMQDPVLNKDIPVFWHLPKAGGSSIKDIIGSCHHKVLASEVGIRNNHQSDTTIAVVNVDGSNFVNVDTTTIEGIERANKMNLAGSELAEVIVIQHLYEAERLFDPYHRGRLFAVFRHPIERAISMFYYLQYANWEKYYHPELSKMTLEEYGNSNLVENNFMVRRLTNVLTKELYPHDLVRAKLILKRKFLIGLLDKFEESFGRFEKYFGWKYKENPLGQEECRAKYLGHGDNTNKEKKKHHLETITPGTPAYEALARQNEWDLQLYQYIKELFEEQEQMFHNISDDYRMEGATCCKCDDPPTC